ncbi:MAG: Gfo/Idh/MocA family oxidoreductase [Rhodospirillales bacterium]|nr:Gfo/Idh/MocA family oxidoreductase [Rhodospirillales bacterium]
MTRPIRAGVIGLGVGEQHVKTYARLPGVEVVAVCDVDPAKLADVAGRYEIERRETDWRRVTEAADIDVVSICSYDDGHAEQAISAFRNGKHAMVEKPICLTRAESEALLRAQQDSGKRVSSNLILRREPRFAELRERIRAGELGEVFHIEGDYLHDILWKITRGWRGRMPFYSVVFGGGIHLIDLMRWLLGDEIREVAAFGNRISAAGSPYRYDDCIVAILKFMRGTTGKTLSAYGPQRTKFHALNVYGTKGSFVNDRPNGKWFVGDRDEDETRIETPYPGARKGDLIPEFVEAIRADREPEVGARDVFRTMDVCLAIENALQTNRNVTVEYLI